MYTLSGPHVSAHPSALRLANFAQIFLDVDDLESIDALEEYIESSQAILVFVSQRVEDGYK